MFYKYLTFISSIFYNIILKIRINMRVHTKLKTTVKHRNFIAQDRMYSNVIQYCTV